MVLEQKLVFPGEFLTVEEEFLPGLNTFEVDGSIFSSKIGLAQFDEKNRKVSVKEEKYVKLLDKGSIVFARVTRVKDSNVLVSIESAEHNGEPRVVPFSNASIYVSNVSRLFVKRVSDLFKVGDIVKAKVLDVSKFAIELSTNDSDLGVIKAFCSRCRQPLISFGGNLKCSNCANNENRKLSSVYAFK